MDFREYSDINYIDLIYFDAFGARVQPGLDEDVYCYNVQKIEKRWCAVNLFSKGGSVRRKLCRL